MRLLAQCTGAPIGYGAMVMVVLYSSTLVRNSAMEAADRRLAGLQLRCSFFQLSDGADSILVQPIYSPRHVAVYATPNLLRI